MKLLSKWQTWRMNQVKKIPQIMVLKIKNPAATIEAIDPLAKKDKVSSNVWNYLVKSVLTQCIYQVHGCGIVTASKSTTSLKYHLKHRHETGANPTCNPVPFKPATKTPRRTTSYVWKYLFKCSLKYCKCRVRWCGATFKSKRIIPFNLIQRESAYGIRGDPKKWLMPKLPINSEQCYGIIIQLWTTAQYHSHIWCSPGSKVNDRFILLLPPPQQQCRLTITINWLLQLRLTLPISTSLPKFEKDPYGFHLWRTTSDQGGRKKTQKATGKPVEKL